MSVLCQYCGKDTGLGSDLDYPFMHGWATCSSCENRIRNGETPPPAVWAKSFYKKDKMTWNYQKPKEIKIFGIKIGEIR